MKNIITMTQEEIRTMINEEVFKNIVRSREMSEWEERNLDNHINGIDYDFPNEIPFPEVEKTENEKANDRLINEVLSKLKWSKNYENK